MFRILSAYTIFGIFAAITETITFHILFKSSKNYYYSTRYSYILSALVSFIGNLKYGFRVDLNFQIAIICFPIIVITNLIILNYLSKIYDSKKIKSIYANILNVLFSSLVNLIFYTLIAKIW